MELRCHQDERSGAVCFFTLPLAGVAEREDGKKNVAGGSTKRNRRNPQIVAAKSAKSRDEALLANKLARMAWAMVAKDEWFKEPVALAA